MKIINWQNTNNSYQINLRQLLEEDDYNEYNKIFEERGIKFDDIARKPSTAIEIIARSIHTFLGNPKEVKYIILDISVIQGATVNDLLKIKQALKEYVENLKYLFVIDRGGDVASDFRKNTNNGKNYYLFTENDSVKLVKDIFDTIINLEDNKLIDKKIDINKFKENEVDETVVDTDDTEKIIVDIEKNEKNIKSEKEKTRGIKSMVISPKILTSNSNSEKNYKDIEPIIYKNDGKSANTYKRERKEQFINDNLMKCAKKLELFTPRRQWKTNNNIIIVKGLYSNIGTTYISILIANILRNENAAVVYINDDIEDFNYTVENYVLEDRGDYYEKNDIAFFKDLVKIPDKTINYYILDTKKSYYSEDKYIRREGLTPIYMVVSGGDSKGSRFIKNELNMLKQYEINNYYVILRNANNMIIEQNKNIKEKSLYVNYIESNPFSELAWGNSFAKNILKILDKKQNINKELIIEQIEEEEEIE